MKPVFPSKKIHGLHNLHKQIRDTHAGYTQKITIPLTMTTEELQKKSSVNVTYKKHRGKKDDYYRYYYYKTYTQKKPEALIAYGHPVFIQRKHKRDK